MHYDHNYHEKPQALKLTTKSTKEILDEEAIVEMAKKDPLHFRPLYEAYFKQIYLFVYHKLYDKELSADITSQVFLKALEAISKYKSNGLPFSAWLYKIAQNETLSYFKKTKKQQYFTIDERTLQNIAEEASGPDKESLFVELESMIKTLKNEDTALIDLRFVEGKSYKEIAFILNTTESNAKTKTWRLLEKIRINIRHSIV